MTSDMYEYRYNGYYHKVELSCGHTFAFYFGVHEGYRLRIPNLPQEESMVPIGCMMHLPKKYRELERALGETKNAPVFKIRCPEHMAEGDYTFKMIEKTWLDMDYDKLNPYTKAMAYCFKGCDSD